MRTLLLPSNSRTWRSYTGPDWSSCLAFQNDIGPALSKACDYDNETMLLVRVAQAVRKDMFDAEFSFNGSFPTVCQRNAVPSSLLALVHMILDGANIKHHTQLVHTTTTTAFLSISQLLVFNMDETCSHQHITTAAKRLHSPSTSHSQNPCSYQK